MVVVDTNIFVGILRKNEFAQVALRRHYVEATVSIVTAMELYAGAFRANTKSGVREVLRPHDMLPLTKSTAERALTLMQEYNTTARRLKLGDALIAATCLAFGCSLLTFNTDDFKFIKGLRLAR